MSRLPSGTGVYDVDPQHDGRHAMALVDDAAKLLQEFVQAHGKGRGYVKPKYKKRAIYLRSAVELEQYQLIELPPTFPSDEQERIDAMIGKIQRELENHPPHDDVQRRRTRDIRDIN